MAGDANDERSPGGATVRREALAGRLWRRWGWLVRWTGTALGIVYVSTLIDVAKVKDAFAKVSLAVMLVSVAIVTASLVLGAVRWRVVLRTYGARARPRLATAVRLYHVALFYNTYLPGAVGGDIVRAVVTRDSFGEHGTTGALAVVFVERLLGLFSLFALVLAGVALSGEALGLQGSLRLASVVGGAASLAALVMLPLGRRLARFLPGPLARIARQLPSVVRPFDFVHATLLSLAGQLIAVIAGWLILRDLHPGVTFVDALLIIPVASATAFLPFTVGGTGAREAAFVVLCSKLLGMADADAVAASLLLWLSTLIVGAAGGVLLVTGRASAPPASPASE
jgi:glycosyltransferase 2 family protein